ncbi:hypothetical protein [Ferdinandcohnia sp. SAFN-114]|uniref:hypothetical protein n=1 Tax=Ferdinandcohnia sp. SAFN-114 TaxID=3387275 RepID=UPI003F801513
MAVIQIGSLSILLKWVILGIAIIAGLVFIKVWLKVTHEKDSQKKIFDILSNGIFIGFVSWKASLLILEPQLVLKSPLSLLYFTGGSDGLLIAVIITILFVFYKLKKMSLSEHQMIQIVLNYSLVVVGGYQTLAAILLGTETLYHVALGVITFILLLFILIRKPSLNGLVNVMIIWLFSMVILQLTLLPQSVRLFLFTMEQWFFISLILISWFYLNKK